MSSRWLLGPVMALLITALACEPKPEWAADPLAARLLQPSYSGHRAAALRELEELDEAGQRAYVPTLVAALDDRNHYVRLNAALTLGRIGGVAAEAVPRLRRVAAEDSDADVRRMAGEALAIQGIDTELFLTSLAAEYDGLRSSRDLADQNLRVAIVSSVSRTLYGWRRLTPEAVDLLVRALEDDAEYVPSRAAQGLYYAVEADPGLAASARDALRRATRHANSNTADMASRALEKLEAATPP